MTTTATQHTDTITVREAAFAEWLRGALLAAIPADGSAITRNDARLTVADRDDAPRGMTTGDVLRGMERLVDEGEIEWVENIVPRRVRRRAPVDAPIALDAARLRTLAAAGVARLASFADNARAELVRSVDPRENVRADYIAAKTTALVSAEAREEGYRAAVADLLGALSTEVGL
mgnify:FL=1